MAKFKVPVVWQMAGYVTVEADDAEEASELAVFEGVPDDGDYISDSFSVDELNKVEEVSC
jgi:hypothetical protein